MSPELEKHSERLQEALRLIGSDEADAIIGESVPELKALHEAAESLAMMNWWVAVGHAPELQVNDDALQLAAQGQAVLLQLVHNAYALGMRRGRAE